MTNNKRNLLPPLLHGRAPEGGNVNDIPRDQVDLERERERVLQSGEKFALKEEKSKREEFFFCSKNARKYDFQNYT